MSDDILCQTLLSPRRSQRSTGKDSNSPLQIQQSVKVFSVNMLTLHRFVMAKDLVSHLSCSELGDR